MLSFRTPVSISSSKIQIQHENAILSIGSCFAQNIGNRLLTGKFSTLLNPFGIVYNPISIQKTIFKIKNKEIYTEKNIIENNGLWHSLDHHGCFSSTNLTEILQNINSAIKNANVFLQSTNRVLITLGTAHVFEYKKTGEVVTNCHKLPNNDFNRKRLNVSEIVAALSATFDLLKSQNEDLKIIMTVSPIRHIRDGLQENQLSKATLLLAIDELVQNFDFVEYFPAYELVLDDLRDYRFYESDMIHPNNLAIDYIWEQFSKTYFSAKTLQLNQQIEQIIRASQHRPFHATSAQYLAFKQQQLEKIERLEMQYDFLNFEKEKKIFEA